MQNPKPSFVYSTATLFVNLTNSVDKQEMQPEMVELAKFSKQHVPEEHPKVTVSLPKICDTVYFMLFNQDKNND